MEHILKLQPKYFDYINNGTKRIELRLYDEKRQKIAIGDTIIFQKEPELETTMKVKVIGLLRYNTFEELYKDFDNISLGYEENEIKDYNKKHNLDIDQVFLEGRKSDNVWWVHFGLNIDNNGSYMRNYYGTLEV